MSVKEEETTVAQVRDALLKAGERRPYLLVLSGSGIGRSLRIDKRTYTIGRALDADFRLDDDGVSRHHAKVVVSSQGVILVKDLGSTNGTFVNDERVSTRPLSEGDVLRLGVSTTLKYGLEDDIEASVRQQLFTAATRDTLTGAYNKRSFEEQMVRAMAFSRRHKQPLSIIVFDVDNFKRVNDRYGHLAGDDVLKNVATLFAKEIRIEDTLARIGGEEFCVILPGVDLLRGILAAERLRFALEAVSVDSCAGPIPVRVSLGVAEFDATRHASLEALTSEADARLYEAKEAGRNRVMPAPPERTARQNNLRTIPDGKTFRDLVGHDLPGGEKPLAGEPVLQNAVSKREG